MINFFCSVEHIKAWRQEHPEVSGEALTLAEAVDIGHRCWRTAREE
ncbi:MAG: hypothetical protein GTN71_02880 [Anaerolineae bacterium]|nr:hypothetical protein [Anaerolineae bacterium]